MGEYEDRYPEAYGRTEDIVQPVAADDHAMPQPSRPSRERPLLERLGLRSPPARMWQHAPAEAPVEMRAAVPDRAPPRAAPLTQPMVAESPAIPPVSAPRGPGLFRGRGPRGYIRSPERIREDLCDRLTENPFIDASDIEVAVTGSEITLTGTVDSVTAFNQAQEIACEVIGASRVNNRLTVRNPTTHPTPGDDVNTAMPRPHRM